MEIIELDTVQSTSAYLSNIADTANHGTVVTAREQTAGRGQRGNSWEAEPGKNITLSLLIKPEGLHPSKQFVISQAVSIAIVTMLDRFIPTEEVSIKWPNDIYVGDRKICGILIESTITGTIVNRCIVGIGLNVNQEHFVSDAPNPVSLRQLLPSARFDVRTLSHSLANNVIDRVQHTLNGNYCAKEYFSRLWRREGWHPYRDNIRKADMYARIDSVAPSGLIALTDRADGITRNYAFKEITAIL